MCGIAGILQLDGARPDEAVLDRMVDVQRHRGPDDEGRYVDGPVALGHLRLAILDLSADGHQPMTNEDGTLWLIFNGEIYNYLELRAELLGRGHRFRSQTDSEVILHAYEEWGASCLDRFNGMFAFAIWDTRTRQLFLARDRLGVKPLYYHQDGRRLMFSSEIKALFADGATPREADLGAVARFVAHRLQDDTDGTSFRDVRQLLPAHWMVVRPDRRDRPRPVRWWTIPRDEASEPLSRHEAGRRLHDLLDDAVALRLRSDVPVGTSLSGGLDSGGVACLAAGRLRADDPGARLATFSSRSSDPRVDEGRYSDQVVERIGATPHDIYPTGASFIEALERVVWHQEEPFHNAACYAHHEVMGLARRSGVTVLLDGPGADEILAGYYYFLPAHFADLALSGRVGRLRREIVADHRLHDRAYPRILAETLRLALPSRGYQRLRALRAQAPWGGPALRPVAERTPRPAETGGRDRLHSALGFAMRTYPLPNYLHQSDRNSMAFSVEARFPFLDFRLVEYAASLPSTHKITDGWTKAVLREALAGVLPEAVRMRARKQGFATDQGRWFRTEAADLMRDLLHGGPALRRGWVDPAWARRTAGDLVAGRPVDVDLAWRCASAEMWARVMLDRSIPELFRRSAGAGSGAGTARGPAGRSGHDDR